jgi:hypothetical protein
MMKAVKTSQFGRRTGSGHFFKEGLFKESLPIRCRLPGHTAAKCVYGICDTLARKVFAQARPVDGPAPWLTSFFS